MELKRKGSEVDIVVWRIRIITGSKDVFSLYTLLKATISDILTKSKSSPIIIIQGDHGSGVEGDWESIENSNLDERLSILNAYFFPNGNYDSLYPSITPVNSFRVVLNQFFDTDFDLLVDESYYGKDWVTNDFINVTDQLR